MRALAQDHLTAIRARVTGMAVRGKKIFDAVVGTNLLTIFEVPLAATVSTCSSLGNGISFSSTWRFFCGGRTVTE